MTQEQSGRFVQFFFSLMTVEAFRPGIRQLMMQRSMVGALWISQDGPHDPVRGMAHSIDGDAAASAGAQNLPLPAASLVVSERLREARAKT
jgi:hypothetical protein